MAFPPDEWVRTKLETEVKLTHPEASLLIDWCHTAREHGPVVLVGTGFSRNAVPRPGWKEKVANPCEEPRVLLWKELADRFREKLRSDGEDEERDPLWLAELYGRQFGRESLIRLIRDAVPVDVLEKGPAHKLLARIPWRAVLTTNYDRFIEEGFEAVRRDCYTVASDVDLVCRRNSGIPVIHLHGIIERSGSIIISLDDYRTYNAAFPGLVTKVRQVFLEHPLLLLGFGATDPNFIQWSGWVGDLVGTHRIRAINLTVSSNRPSDARRRYWQEAFSFINIPLDSVDKIEKLLAILRAALDEEPAHGIEERIANRLSWMHTVPDVIKELLASGKYIASYSRPPATHIYCHSLVKEALQRIVEIKHPSNAKSVWERLSCAPAGLAQRLDLPQADEAPTADEQRQMARSLIGDHWGEWLLAVHRLEGRSFTLGYTPISIKEECAQLPAATPAKVSNELRFRVAMRLLEDDPDLDPSETLSAWTDSRTLTKDELAAVEDLIARRALRGQETPGSPDSDSVDSQELRRAGFLAIMSGDLPNAVKAYMRAARASQGRDPEHVEWVTVEAALSTRTLALWGKEIEDDEDVQDLQDRLKYLERQCKDWHEWVVSTKIKARDILIKQLRDDISVGGRVDVANAVPEECEELLLFLERVWASPSWTGGAADAVGQLMWMSGQKTRAVQTLSRYGAQTLRILVTELATARFRSGFDDVVEQLLKKGRWASEWIARVEGLSAVVRELTNRQVNELVMWVESCASALKWEAMGEGMVRANNWSMSISPAEELAQVLVGAWRYLQPQEVIEKWNVIERNCGEKRGMEDIFVAEVTSRLGEMPWSTWIRNGFDPAIVDRFLAHALARLRRHNTRAGLGVFNLLDYIEHIIIDVDRVDKEPVLREATLLRAEILDWAGSANVTDARAAGVLFWKFALAGERDGKIAHIRAAIDGVRRNLHEPVTYPSPCQAMLNVVAAGAYLASNSPEVHDDLVKLIGEIRALFKAEKKSTDDSHKRRQEAELARTVSRLCANVLLIETDATISDTCNELLEECFVRTPLAAEHVARVPVGRLASCLAERLHVRVSSWLRGLDGLSGYTPRELRNAAIHACWKRAARNPTDGLVDEWLDGVCVLATSDDRLIAYNACSVIEYLIRSRKLDSAPDRAISLMKMSRALIGASSDPRAFVLGEAAAAIVHACEAYPEARDALDQTLVHLRTSDRAEVSLRLHGAEAELVPKG